MKILQTTLLTISIALLAVNSANATSGKPYIGAKVGKLFLAAKDKTFNADITVKNPLVYGVYGGYHFNHRFSLEGEYLSSDTTTAEWNFITSSKFSISSMGAYGSIHQSLNQQLYVKARAGFAQITAEIERDSTKEKATGPAFGLFAGYKINRDISLEGEFSVLPTVEDNLTELKTMVSTVGLHMHF